MSNFNQLIIIGHLTRDPEIKFLQNQTQVCNCGVAVNHKYKDKEEVCFLDFVAFGTTAENISKFFQKGRAIMLIGRLKHETWEDKQTGTKRSKHVMVVDRFTFVGDKGTGGVVPDKGSQDQAANEDNDFSDPNDIPF